MRILFIGDIVGSPGRRAVALLVPKLRQELALDIVIANGENVAGGRGLTPATANELFSNGIDILTSGNHIWDNREIIPHLDGESPILRPYNYPPGNPGRGLLRYKGLVVLNLLGRTFMQPVDDPFRAADEVLSQLEPGSLVFVDFHAEATSEKQALGWYLDGRVSAVVGTHTHVPTADPRLLPKGTAYVTDAGMCGAKDSVIGDEIEAVLQLFLTQRPTRLVVAEHSPTLVLNAVLIDVDEESGRARSIERVDYEVAADGK